MRNRPTRLRNFFSLNQWRKRFGAKEIHSDNGAIDYQSMKQNVIQGALPQQTRGHSKNLPVHIENLRREFSGQPELVFYHAKLIVLIRREYKIDEVFAEFEKLWAQEEDWLRENLNIRWLVSATDTFSDHSKDPIEKTLAFSNSLMINTLKVYETENFLKSTRDLPYDQSSILATQSGLIPLFEGLSSFTAGTDDTLRNMVWRMNDIAKGHVTGRILLEVFNRLQYSDTAFSRLRQIHTSNTTKWW